MLGYNRVCLWAIINTATRWLHTHILILSNSSDPLWKFGIWRPITLIILPFSSITLIHMLSEFYFSCVCIVGCFGLSVSQHKIAPNSEKRVYVYSGRKKRGSASFLCSIRARNSWTKVKGRDSGKLFKSISSTLKRYSSIIEKWQHRHLNYLCKRRQVLCICPKIIPIIFCRVTAEKLL